MATLLNSAYNTNYSLQKEQRKDSAVYVKQVIKG